MNLEGGGRGGEFGMSAVSCGNGKLRQWLIDQIDSGKYPGLVWENEEKSIFRIPWKHAGKQDYNREEDAALFKVSGLGSRRGRAGEGPEIEPGVPGAASEASPGDRAGRTGGRRKHQVASPEPQEEERRPQLSGGLRGPGAGPGRVEAAGKPLKARPGPGKGSQRLEGFWLFVCAFSFPRKPPTLPPGSCLPPPSVGLPRSLRASAPVPASVFVSLTASLFLFSLLFSLSLSLSLSMFFLKSASLLAPASSLRVLPPLSFSLCVSLSLSFPHRCGTQGLCLELSPLPFARVHTRVSLLRLFSPEAVYPENYASGPSPHLWAEQGKGTPSGNLV